jgi:predicted aspartyl protease
MPDYDANQFNPPAPLARVTVRTRDRANSVSDVPMLIDSGSDTTLIPRSCADRLGLRGETQEGVLLVGFDGSESRAEVVDVEVRFLRRTFRGEFPIIDDEVGILGRNVLNRLSIVLDGPRLDWHEEKD